MNNAPSIQSNINRNEYKIGRSKLTQFVLNADTIVSDIVNNSYKNVNGAS